MKTGGERVKNTSETAVFRKKGFFIALYSCLGVVAVLALVVTFANRTPGIEMAHDLEAFEEAAPVGADQVEPYLAGVDEEAWFRPRQPQPTEPPPTPTPQRPAPTPAPATIPPEPEPEPEPPTPPPEPEPEPTPQPAPEPQADATPPQPVTFTPFSDYDRMVWPVYGETVMPFSTAVPIYDPTLDQFRTNDNLLIAAEMGDAVRAGADGKVISIGRNIRQGSYITIDHGNGWVATYAQLMDTALVEEGEIVHGGQIIGGVGEPSIFGSAHGTHVHLHIQRDNIAINPYYVLAERSDY